MRPSLQKADCAIVAIDTDEGVPGIGEACAYGVPPALSADLTTEWTVAACTHTHRDAYSLYARDEKAVVQSREARANTAGSNPCVGRDGLESGKQAVS